MTVNMKHLTRAALQANCAVIVVGPSVSPTFQYTYRFFVPVLVSRAILFLADVYVVRNVAGAFSTCQGCIELCGCVWVGHSVDNRYTVQYIQLTLLYAFHLVPSWERTTSDCRRRNDVRNISECVLWP